jgi:hypothetical protein
MQAQAQSAVSPPNVNRVAIYCRPLTIAPFGAA